MTENKPNCPYCGEAVEAPAISPDSPLFAAVEEEIKDFRREDLDARCQEGTLSFLPQTEFLSECISCGALILIKIFNIHFECRVEGDDSSVSRLNEYQFFWVSETIEKGT